MSGSSFDRALRGRVYWRAKRRCEYCQMSMRYDALPFEIDHVIARKHGGATTSGNLALACYACNAYKGPNIAGLDPDTGELTRLFHPRQDDWPEHFAWTGFKLVGRTPVGRATLAVLRMNAGERLALREALIEEGVFPPTE